MIAGLMSGGGSLDNGTEIVGLGLGMNMIIGVWDCSGLIWFSCIIVFQLDFYSLTPPDIVTCHK